VAVPVSGRDVGTFDSASDRWLARQRRKRAANDGLYRLRCVLGRWSVMIALPRSIAMRNVIMKRRRHHVLAFSPLICSANWRTRLSPDNLTPFTGP